MFNHFSTINYEMEYIYHAYLIKMLGKNVIKKNYSLPMNGFDWVLFEDVFCRNILEKKVLISSLSLHCTRIGPDNR